MKVINCGYTQKSGKPGDDDSNLLNVFELGWEITTSRVAVMNSLVSGSIEDSSHILTSPGRSCLYDGVFENVHEGEESLPSGFEMVNLHAEMCHGILSGKIDPTYGAKSIEDRTVLGDYSKHLLSKFGEPVVPTLPMKKFVCVCLRFRDHDSHRNAPMDLFQSVIDEYLARDYAIYLVGFGSEKYEREEVRSVSLRDFAYLTSHKLCKGVIGTTTGTILLSFFSARNGVPIFILDQPGDKKTLLERNHILCGSPSMAIKESAYITRSVVMPKALELVNLLTSKEEQDKFEWDYKDDQREWRFS